MLWGNFEMLFCKELGTLQIRPCIFQPLEVVKKRKMIKRKTIFNQCPSSTEVSRLLESPSAVAEAKAVYTPYVQQSYSLLLV